MLRFPFRSPRLAGLAILFAVALEACGSATTDAGGTSPAPAFALTSGASTLVLTAGGTAHTSIRARRTAALIGAIDYTVTGAPAGLTATFATTSVRDSLTLTVTASATLAPATYPIVVNATAAGAVAQQAGIAVTVNGPAGVAPPIKSVAAGEHSCALTTSGAAYCWGFNETGQLGNNDTSIVNATPVAVVGGLAFQSISVSKVEGSTCALTIAGAAYCWGNNSQGQLGDGTTTRRLVPTRVAAGLTFKSLALGDGHACGVATNGTAYCWGSTANGAFGDGTIEPRYTPSVAALGMTFDSIVAGSDYTCALTPAGAAFCWGLGFSGQLGNDSSMKSTVPVAVAGGLAFRSLAAGGLGVCGLTTAGKAYCWGQNFYGTVGDGTSGMLSGAGRRLAPVAVAGGLTFQSLSAGYQTVCGVADSGAGYCWGYNFGAVGDGTEDHRANPTAVAGGLTFQSMSSGTGYSCGVTTANAVFCWGDNGDGSLGDGTLDERLTPTPVRWP